MASSNTSTASQDTTASSSDANPETFLTGSCLCKGVRYTVTSPPALSLLCHCMNCKKVSGSDFAHNLRLRKEHFHIPPISVPFLFTYNDTSAASGATDIYRHFCGNCGSPIYVTKAAYPDVLAFSAGTLDDNQDIGDLKPSIEFFCEKKGWMKDVGLAETRFVGMGDMPLTSRSDGGIGEGKN